MKKSKTNLVSDCERCGEKTPIILLNKKGLCPKCAYKMRKVVYHADGAQAYVVGKEL